MVANSRPPAPREPDLDQIASNLQDLIEGRRRYHTRLDDLLRNASAAAMAMGVTLLGMNVAAMMDGNWAWQPFGAVPVLGIVGILCAKVGMTRAAAQEARKEDDRRRWTDLLEARRNADGFQPVIRVNHGYKALDPYGNVLPPISTNDHKPDDPAQRAYDEAAARSPVQQAVDRIRHKRRWRRRFVRFARLMREI